MSMAISALSESICVTAKPKDYGRLEAMVFDDFVKDTAR